MIVVGSAISPDRWSAKAQDRAWGAVRAVITEAAHAAPCSAEPLVWGDSIVRSFAEIILTPLVRFGWPELCEVARPNKIDSIPHIEF